MNNEKNNQDRENLNRLDERKSSERKSENVNGLNSTEIRMQLERIENVLSEKNENESKKLESLKNRIEELEKSEQNRNERAKSLVNKLEGSTSNFNNKLDVFEEKTKHARLNFETTAKHYIKRLDEDNLKLDFQKAIQDELSDTKKEVSEVLDQARNETYLYKETLENRLRDNNKLVDKFNKSIDLTTKAITSLFYVIAIIALMTFVTGPIGHFFGVESLYSFINSFIDDHESAWRYLMGILYLLPYVCFGLIMWLTAKCLDAIK